MMVSFVFLFLPAAGYVYWSIMGSTLSSAYVALRFGSVRFGEIVFSWDRYGHYPIRLASRSELSVVMVVVFGLLFLPAAGWITKGPWKINGGWARYWAVTGGADYSGNKRGYNIDFQGAKVYLEGLMARYTGLSIRLASRSELFGCSVGGVESSVPARWYWLFVDYFDST